MTEIYNESRIDSLDISLDYMKPLLYHAYCMKALQGPDTNCTIEVDHIMPKTLFDNSSVERKGVIQNNLFNLGLLPKKENISKSNNKLKLIDDEWLISQIEKYEFIERSEFEKYSNLNNYQDMFTKRFEIFKKAFTDDRNNILNN